MKIEENIKRATDAYMAARGIKQPAILNPDDYKSPLEDSKAIMDSIIIRWNDDMYSNMERGAYIHGLNMATHESDRCEDLQFLRGIQYCYADGDKK